MIRLSQKQARHIAWVLLGNYSHMEGGGWLANFDPSRISDEEVREFANDMYHSSSAPSLDDTKTILETLDEQMPLEDGEEGHNDGEIISAIVDILQDHYTRNVLSGGTLGYLRKAILVPQELKAWKDHIAGKDRCCSSCGHKLLAGEMTTFHPDSFHEAGFICARCDWPKAIPCEEPGCNDYLPMKRGASLQTRCAVHRQKDKGKSVKATGTSIDVASPASPGGGYPPWQTLRMAEPSPTFTASITARLEAERRSFMQSMGFGGAESSPLSTGEDVPNEPR